MAVELTHRYRARRSEIDLFLFSPLPFPSKIIHARINPPRVLRCYVANLFHARSSLSKINPLAITSSARAKRYKPLCAWTRARVTSHFADKTDGIVSAGRLFKRIVSPDIASNIFNALLNNPQTVYTADYCSRVTVCSFLIVTVVPIRLGLWYRLNEFSIYCILNGKITMVNWSLKVYQKDSCCPRD